MTAAADALPEAGGKPKPHPSVRRPYDAATIMLVDQSGPEPRVLFGKRNPRHVFMPGRFVFPGGRVERADSRMNSFGVLDEKVEGHLMARILRPSPARARAFALAAVRELAEETGLFFGSTEAGAPPVPDLSWQPFADAGVYPSLEGLWLVARALTPPGLVRRFDTRFFAADASLVVHEEPGAVGPDSEFTELVWATFEDMKELDLHPVTQTIIGLLRERLDAGLERDLPIPFLYRRRGTLFREEI